MRSPSPVPSAIGPVLAAAACLQAAAEQGEHRLGWVREVQQTQRGRGADSQVSVGTVRVGHLTDPGDRNTEGRLHYQMGRKRLIFCFYYFKINVFAYCKR